MHCRNQGANKYRKMGLADLDSRETTQCSAPTVIVSFLRLGCSTFYSLGANGTIVEWLLVEFLDTQCDWRTTIASLAPGGPVMCKSKLDRPQSTATELSGTSFVNYSTESLPRAIRFTASFHRTERLPKSRFGTHFRWFSCVCSTDLHSPLLVLMQV